MACNVKTNKLVRQLGTGLTALIRNYRFTAPIGVVVDGSNRSKIVGTYRPDPDGSGLMLEIEKQEIYGGGFKLPIDVEFQDSSTNRAAGLRIEEEGKWYSRRPTFV